MGGFQTRGLPLGGVILVGNIMSVAWPPLPDDKLLPADMRANASGPISSPNLRADLSRFLPSEDRVRIVSWFER